MSGLLNLKDSGIVIEAGGDARHSGAAGDDGRWQCPLALSSRPGILKAHLAAQGNAVNDSGVAMAISGLREVGRSEARLDAAGDPARSMS